MRADRLIAILLLLQQRGRVSAAAIAGELEVSRRTVMRDLEALAMAGVPIYAVRGPRGGYELWEGFRTQLTGMTAAEVRALSALGLPHAADLFGLGNALLRARLKTTMNLPPDVHDELDWLSRVFLYDPVPHGDASLPEELTMLAAAIERRRVVRARLSAADVTKTVYPLALVDNAGTWLLIADVAGRRSAFDVAGLHDVATTGRRFNRPDDFDLRAFWEQWRSEERALGESWRR